MALLLLVVVVLLSLRLRATENDENYEANEILRVNLRLACKNFSQFHLYLPYNSKLKSYKDHNPKMNHFEENSKKLGTFLLENGENYKSMKLIALKQNQGLLRIFFSQETTWSNQLQCMSCISFSYHTIKKDD